MKQSFPFRCYRMEVAFAIVMGLLLNTARTVKAQAQTLIVLLLFFFPLTLFVTAVLPLFRRCWVYRLLHFACVLRLAALHCKDAILSFALHHNISLPFHRSAYLMALTRFSTTSKTEPP